MTNDADKTKQRHFMGLSVLPRAPSIKAFQRSGTFDEIKSMVAVKMKDVDAVSRLAATPGGRKAAKRARDRLRLPFERGEGRRHATSIYSTAPSVSAYYKL